MRIERVEDLADLLKDLDGDLDLFQSELGGRRGGSLFRSVFRRILELALGLLLAPRHGATLGLVQQQVGGRFDIPRGVLVELQREHRVVDGGRLVILDLVIEDQLGAVVGVRGEANASLLVGPDRGPEGGIVEA